VSNPSTELARGVVATLIEGGVTEIVLAPGSRNAPLAFAAYDAAVAGLVRLHTRLDERSAGFLGLGLTKVGSRAAVVCTSGTAVANLHPAVLEASHSGVPLVVVTADRPARLRGTSANQTTDQVGFFGPAVASFDLSVDGPPFTPDLLPPIARHHRVGPVFGPPYHLNVQLDAPLVPGDRWVPEELRFGPKRQDFGPQDCGLGPNGIPIGPRTVVLAGDDAGPPARILAQRAGWPLLAEPTAGCRTGDNALRCYRLLLDGDLGQRIERVLVFGHPTLSRPVTRLLDRPEVEVWATASIRGRRPFEVATELATTTEHELEGADDPAWLEEWKTADRSVAAQLDALLAAEPGLTPHQVAGAVSRAVPPGGLLVVGASSPIRDLDLMAVPYAVGDRRKVIANRGLAGIDGTVSTAIGAALGRRRDRALALLGDVTFLHDMGGLVLGPDEPRPDLTLVVVNDNGGAIFAMLEQGAEEYADRYDRLFGTPHGVDIASLCAATRTPHWRVDSLPELEHALASPAGGIEVIEVAVDRSRRRELDQRVRALRP